MRISNNEHNQAMFHLTTDMIKQVHSQVAVTLQAGSFGVPIAGKKADNLFIGCLVVNLVKLVNLIKT